MNTKKEIQARIRRNAGDSKATTTRGQHRYAMRHVLPALLPLPQRGKPLTYSRRPAPELVTFVVDWQVGNSAMQRAMAQHKSRQNWESPRPGDGSVETIDNGRYSRSCSYTHYTYRPTYVSRATLAPRNNSIVYETRSRSRQLVAPAGLYWSHDADGLMLIRKSDGMDYHPTSEDLLARNFATRVRRAMAENYKKRALLRKYKTEQAVLDYLLRSNRRRVSLRAMSRAAGNCEAGTESWLARLGIANRERAIAGAVYRLAHMKNQASLLFTSAAEVALRG